MIGRSPRQTVRQPLVREKATDEQGNLYETTIWKVPVSSKYCEASAIGWLSSGAGKTRRQCFTITTTPRVIIGISASAKNLMNSGA
jgi:hypothetical protein